MILYVVLILKCFLENAKPSEGNVQAEIISNALIAVFQIGHSEETNPARQLNNLGDFMKLLKVVADGISDLKPEIIVSEVNVMLFLGRDVSVGEAETARFMDCIIGFVKTVCAKNINMRTVLLRSEYDRYACLDDVCCENTSRTLIGDGPTKASMMLQFCEFREFMVSSGMYRWLHTLDLSHKYDLQKNEVFITRDNMELKTYSYIPSPDDESTMYSPKNPLHKYKKYNFFPPIKGQTVNYFCEVGLEFELERIISQAYESIQSVNRSGNMLSGSSVLTVLTQLKYDPDDIVYVVSREERGENFWSQKNKEEYISLLKGNMEKNGRVLNQYRVRVVSGKEESVMRVKDKDGNIIIDSGNIANDLVDIHSPNTLFTLPFSEFMLYRNLCQLQFGVTISTKYKYAIIPTPATEEKPFTARRVDDIDVLMSKYMEWGREDGPMRAVITADQDYVEVLIAEFKNLISGQLKEGGLTILK